MSAHDGRSLDAHPDAGAAVAVALLAMSSTAGPYASVAFSTPPKSQVLDVTVESARVSLIAREAPLADVLAAIGRQASVKVVLRDALRTTVTATFVNIPLEEAVRRLGRRHSIALIYDRSAGAADGSVLSEVWVRSAYPEMTGAYRRQAQETAEGAGGHRHPADRPPTELDRWARNLMTLKEASPENRTRQLQALVLAHGSAAVVAALRGLATIASAAEVRRAAIQVLSSMGGPDAIDAIRATLPDTDPGVRDEAQTALRRLRRAPANDGSSD